MASSSSLPSYLTLIKPYHKTRTQALQVKSQRFRDEGRSKSNIVDANLSVLRERIEEMKMKERLQRCCRSECGWNFAPGYNHKLNNEAKLLSEFVDVVGLVFGTIGFTCLGSTIFLCLFFPFDSFLSIIS